MKKSKVLVCAVLLIALCIGVVAGTVSYMQYSTPEGQELVNTFIAAGSSIVDPNVPDDVFPDGPTDDEKTAYNFNLWETESKLNAFGTAYELVPGGEKVKRITYSSVVPGMEIEKDPVLSVNILENVSAYVFVEVLDETNGNLDYEINTAYWTKLEGVIGNHGGAIYVYTDPTTGSNALVGKSTDEGWYEISESTGGYIIRDNSITVNSNLPKDVEQLGTLKFYGYICQSVGFENATDAYNNAF